MKKWEKDMQGHAVSEYPRECCGLLVSVKGRKRYLPCRNLADDKESHFIMDKHDYCEAEDQGKIVALVHSHPNESSRPSPGDKVQCEGSGLPWVILSLMPGEDGEPCVADTHEFRPTGYQAPYEGREFQHGILDCAQLLVDWYEREWGLQMPEIERRDDWWNDGHSNLYMDNLGRAGFEIIGQYPELEIGDMVLMEIRSGNKVPNHAGVYVGDGQMLHHYYNRMSCKEEYMGYWREVTRWVARYKGEVPDV